MPKKLEDCVSDLKAQGKSESEAYAICGKSTGWVRKKGGGWKNTKTGEIYEEDNVNEDFLPESFLDLFLESKDNPYEGIKKGAFSNLVTL
jgi:hypothetical protein